GRDADIGFRSRLTPRCPEAQKAKTRPISCSSSSIARSLQKHFPFTVAIFEHSLKLIRAKLPGKGLPTDRGAKRAVFANGPVDVRSIVRELSLACDNRTLDGHGNFG